MTKLLQNINFGETLKYYRNLKGYSQIDVASKMQLFGSDISSGTYSKIERGERNIYFDDFIILKLVLEFEYNDFFKEYENNILSKYKEI